MNDVLTIVSDSPDTPDLSPDPTYEKQYGQFKTYKNVRVQKRGETVKLEHADDFQTPKVKKIQNYKANFNEGGIF